MLLTLRQGLVTQQGEGCPTLFKPESPPKPPKYSFSRFTLHFFFAMLYFPSIVLALLPLSDAVTQEDAWRQGHQNHISLAL